MGKKFKISEEQYRMALKEGITLNADVNAANGDVKQAVSKTCQDARNNGVNLDDANIQLKASDANEGRVISKSQVMESRRKTLDRYANLYSAGDFIKRLSWRK